MAKVDWEAVGSVGWDSSVMRGAACQHRSPRQSRATRVATGLTVALLIVSASTLAVGCGSSSSSGHSNSRSNGSRLAVPGSHPQRRLEEAAPRAERSFEQQTPRAEQAYHSQVNNLCSKIYLPRFNPRGEGARETSEEAELEIEALEHIRRRIDRLRVLSYMRTNRQAYLRKLASALLLDRRIVAYGGEGSVLPEAMTQHQDNSQRRSEIAERLRIWCL